MYENQFQEMKNYEISCNNAYLMFPKTFFRKNLYSLSQFSQIQKHLLYGVNNPSLHQECRQP